MTATVTEARDQLYALLKAAMDANSPSTVIIYDDAKNDNPIGSAAWVRVSVRHTSGGQSTISRQGGISRYTRTGTVYVNIFGTPGDGLSSVDPLVKIALDAYEGKTTAGNIWFTKSRVRELGIVDNWYQCNVLIDFSYDEVK